MNKYQFRAIRNSYKRDYIFLKGTEYNNNLIDKPIMGKRIQDIVIYGKKPRDIMCSYHLIKGDNVYEAYSIHYNHSSQTMYVITKNGKIIYWISSSIFAPASTAWAILTEVYHGYRDNASIYQWQSVEDFECFNRFFNDILKPNDYKFFNLSEYQEKKLKETGIYYIDKRIITKERANEILNKLNSYHI